MVLGRFAPTPSGRMHLGNVFAALIAWLSARSQGGGFVLRMEDLDTLRTSDVYAQAIREDLRWLGLTCLLHSPNAPHLSDGTYVYPGTCRDLTEAQRGSYRRAPAWRVKVPDRVFRFTDLAQGEYRQNLATDCGDFVVRRADGVYVYQLAVTVDDGETGVTEVVRGADLLSSTPRQMYLQELFGFSQPRYGHVPMLLAPDGRRLSKRDRDLDLGALRQRMPAEALLGTLAHAAGMIDRREPVSAQELMGEFTWDRLRREAVTLDPALLE